jgi:hypothetical protein
VASGTESTTGIYSLTRARRPGFGYNATVALKRRVFPGLPERASALLVFPRGAAFRAGAFCVAAVNRPLAVADAHASMLGV